MLFFLGFACLGYALVTTFFMGLGVMGSTPWYHYPLCFVWPVYIPAVWLSNR